MQSAEDRFIDARLSEGVETPEGFRAALARHFGLEPDRLPADGALRADRFVTPLGAMIAVCDAAGLHLLEFADRRALPGELRKLHAAAGGVSVGRCSMHDRVEREMEAFFAGRSADFSTPLVLHGGAFACAIWNALRATRAGETLSYGELARRIGVPRAVRAAARANGANQIAVIVPCHRIVGADGALTGYGGGLWRKQALIDIEQAYR